MNRILSTILALFLPLVCMAEPARVAVLPANSQESRFLVQILEPHLKDVRLIERASLGALYEESKLQSAPLDVLTPDYLVLVQTHFQSKYNHSDRYEIAATFKVVLAMSSEIVHTTTVSKTVADRKIRFAVFVPQIRTSLPINIDLSTTEQAALQALAKDGAHALNAVFKSLSAPKTGQGG